MERDRTEWPHHRFLCLVTFPPRTTQQRTRSHTRSLHNDDIPSGVSYREGVEHCFIKCDVPRSERDFYGGLEEGCPKRDFFIGATS